MCIRDSREGTVAFSEFAGVDRRDGRRREARRRYRREGRREARVLGGGGDGGVHGAGRRGAEARRDALRGGARRGLVRVGDVEGWRVVEAAAPGAGRELERERARVFDARDGRDRLAEDILALLRLVARFLKLCGGGALLCRARAGRQPVAREEATRACMKEMEDHLVAFLKDMSRGTIAPSYEEWVTFLHPENSKRAPDGAITLDARLLLVARARLQQEVFRLDVAIDVSFLMDGLEAQQNLRSVHFSLANRRQANRVE